HIITAVATDQFGNTSPASAALSIQIVRDIPAPTLVGAGQGTASTQNNASNTLTQTGVTVAVGNTIFVTIGMDPDGTPAPTVTVSDSGGNTYSKDADVSNGSGTAGVRTLIFSAPVTHALSNGTITITVGNAVNMASTYFYSSGLVSPLPEDQSH